MTEPAATALHSSFGGGGFGGGVYRGSGGAPLPVEYEEEVAQGTIRTTIRTEASGRSDQYEDDFEETVAYAVEE